MCLSILFLFPLTSYSSSWPLSFTTSLLLEFACDSHEFACASGDQCIHSVYQCDGVFDCRDHSDERDCRKSQTDLRIHAV